MASREALRKERFLGFEQAETTGAVMRKTGRIHAIPTSEQHYGFVSMHGISGLVFVSQRIIKESGFAPRLGKGTIVDCSIEHRERRGWRVTKIHAISV